MHRWVSYLLVATGLTGVTMQMIFTVLSPALVGLCAALVGLPLFLDRSAPRALAPAKDDAFGLRPHGSDGEVDPHDPVDQCEHQNAEAVPVEVDVTGDLEPEIVGWLCIECGAKVSPAAAVRRNLPGGEQPQRHVPMHINTLRQALRQAADRTARLSDDWQADTGGNFVLDKREYDDYKTALAEAKRIKAILDEAEERAEQMRKAGVKCSGYREVAGHSPGSVTRRYAVPGECLCGSCWTDGAPGVVPRR